MRMLGKMVAGGNVRNKGSTSAHSESHQCCAVPRSLWFWLISRSHFHRFVVFVAKWQVLFWNTKVSGNPRAYDPKISTSI
jgi:hypothetical protein